MTDTPPLFYRAEPPDWQPVSEPDALKWALWFRMADRRVAYDEVAECRVSTVFLGLKTCSPRSADPGLDYMFETMVFGPDEVIAQLVVATTDDVTSVFTKFFGGTPDFQRRYRTAAEARAGHAQTVRFVRRVLLSRN